MSDPKDYISIVKELIKILEEKGLSDLELTHEDIHIRLAKNQGPGTSGSVVAPAPVISRPTVLEASQSPDLEAEHSDQHIVRAPFVGIVYLTPSPESEAFVTVGSRVQKGQPLLILEAMKVMNKISSPVSGVIKRILVKNEQPVEYDQGLISIECG